MIASADLDILSSSSTKYDRGLPSISFDLSLASTFRVLFSYFVVQIPGIMVLAVANCHFLLIT
jgi:hypothetical protein